MLSKAQDRLFYLSCCESWKYLRKTFLYKWLTVYNFFFISIISSASQLLLLLTLLSMALQGAALFCSSVMVSILKKKQKKPVHSHLSLSYLAKIWFLEIEYLYNSILYWFIPNNGFAQWDDNFYSSLPFSVVCSAHFSHQIPDLCFHSIICSDLNIVFLCVSSWLITV